MDSSSDRSARIPFSRVGDGGRRESRKEKLEATGSSRRLPIAGEAGICDMLVSSVQDYAIFALDPEGYILSWNKGGERLKGYKKEEILGRHFSIFYMPEDLENRKPQEELDVATKEGRVEDEGWRIRKDGSRFWANVVITPLRDGTGTLIGFAKVVRDLTEKRRAEELLKESEERFRLLVHGVRDYAIFMLDPEGRIASWNEGARRIKGYKSSEIIGKHFSVFYPAEDIAAGKPAWELNIVRREGQYEEEGWRIRKDGSSFWASVLITRLRNADGEIFGFAKVTRDLTERKAAQERALADARRVAEAESANRTKSEFLTAMSHELRTPINATLGYTELMMFGMGGEVSEQQQEYLGRIRASQEHLLRIVSDLLNYSRIEAGRIEYELHPVALHEIVQSVIPMIQPQAIAKDIKIKYISCSKKLSSRTDRSKAEQILLNLLGNAVKFTPPEGEIEVSCEELGKRVTINVSDTGPGVPEEKMRAIFEPFVQLGRSLTSGHEGTGLGLAISRDLARAMGGELEVARSRKGGALFTLTLPLS